MIMGLREVSSSVQVDRKHMTQNKLKMATGRISETHVTPRTM